MLRCLLVLMLLTGCSIPIDKEAKLYIDSTGDAFCSNERLTNCIHDRRGR